MKKDIKHKAVRAYLKAYGYTPQTLAADLEIDARTAAQVLDGEGYFSRKVMDEMWFVFGFYYDTMYGHTAPGSVRQRIVSWHNSVQTTKSDLDDIKHRSPEKYSDMMEKATAEGYDDA